MCACCAVPGHMHRSAPSHPALPTCSTNTCGFATCSPGFAGTVSVQLFEICSVVGYPLPFTAGEKAAGQIQPLPLTVLGHISTTPWGTVRSMLQERVKRVGRTRSWLLLLQIPKAVLLPLHTVGSKLLSTGFSWRM